MINHTSRGTWSVITAMKKDMSESIVKNWQNTYKQWKNLNPKRFQILLDILFICVYIKSRLIPIRNLILVLFKLATIQVPKSLGLVPWKRGYSMVLQGHWVMLSMHVPRLMKSLISLGALDTLDYDFSIINGVININKGVWVAMKGKKVKILYTLIGKTILGGTMLWRVFCQY